MRNKILALIMIGLAFNSYAQKKTGFTLTGKTNHIPNRTLIYLIDFDNRLLIDTARVKNNSFIFKKELPRSPIKIMLTEKGKQNSKIFWLDNNSATFDASMTDFENALIIGSETERVNKNLKKILDTTEYRYREKVEIEFIKNNPNSIIGARLLSSYSKKWGKQKTKELYDKLSVENQKSFYGKKVAEYFTLNRALQIGDKFSNLKIPDKNGNIRELSELKGKIVLLEFWASWCKPCRAENPNLIKNYEKYKDFGFDIFAVSLDDSKTGWLKAIKQDHTKWIHVCELRNDDKASIIYGVSAIPDNFLIDRNGVIVGRNLRGNNLNKKLSELMPVANKVYKK